MAVVLFIVGYSIMTVVDIASDVVLLAACLLDDILVDYTTNTTSPSPIEQNSVKLACKLCY